MAGRNGATFLAIAATVALAACASKGAVRSGAAPTGGDADDALAVEYQQLIDNAINPVVCRQQDVTGSRIHKREVCIRLAEVESEREQALRLVHEIRDRTTSMPQRSVGMPPSRP